MTSPPVNKKLAEMADYEKYPVNKKLIDLKLGPVGLRTGSEGVAPHATKELIDKLPDLKLDGQEGNEPPQSLASNKDNPNLNKQIDPKTAAKINAVLEGLIRGTLKGKN